MSREEEKVKYYVLKVGKAKEERQKTKVRWNLGNYPVNTMMTVKTLTDYLDEDTKFDTLILVYLKTLISLFLFTSLSICVAVPKTTIYYNTQMEMGWFLQLFRCFASISKSLIFSFFIKVFWQYISFQRNHTQRGKLLFVSKDTYQGQKKMKDNI